MSSIYRGNWPHDKSEPPQLEREDPVVVEMDTGQHWAPRDYYIRAAVGLEEVERAVNLLVRRLVKDVLSRINIGLIVPGKEVSGWPLPAVAVVKEINVSVKLEYKNQEAKRGKGKKAKAKS